MLVKDTSCIILEFTGMKGLIVKIHQLVMMRNNDCIEVIIMFH